MSRSPSKMNLQRSLSLCSYRSSPFMRKRRTTTEMMSEMTISIRVGMRRVLREVPITLVD